MLLVSSDNLLHGFSKPGRIVILHRRYDEIGRIKLFLNPQKSVSKQENVRNIEQILLDDTSKCLFIVWGDIEHMQNGRHCDEYTYSPLRDISLDKFYKITKSFI